MIEDRATAGPDGSAPERESDKFERAATGARYRRYVLAAVIIALLALPLFRPMISSYNYVLTLGALVLMSVAIRLELERPGGFAGYISLGHSASSSE